MTAVVHQFEHTAEVTVDPQESIARMLRDRAEHEPRAVVFERRTAIGAGWVPLTVAAFRDQVVEVAKGLAASGLEIGDRVGIMAGTSYEWTLLDFAAWTAGLVPVPVYETSSADQTAHILGHSGAKLVVTETSAQKGMVERLNGALPEPVEALALDEDALETLEARGRGVGDDEIERRTDALTKDSLATIIYTSGTTGRPKGVMLSHECFLHLTHNAPTDPGLRKIVKTPGARTLLFLPLAHVFARFIEVLCVHQGVVMGHAAGATHLVADLQSFRPTFLLAVPRVFEKVYNAADAKAGSGVKLQIFRWAAKVALEYSRALDTPQGPSRRLRAQHRAADRLVYGNIREVVSTSLKDTISGGAPLGERLGHFFRGMGLNIYEGYGLTETSAPTCVNLPAKVKIGTVGPAYPGTTIGVSDEGEVLAKGPHVMVGYWNDPEATAAALTEDGWLRTGDLGTLDDDGYLRITGRAKDIIVTAGGKNVAPAVLEDRLRGHPLVSQVVVVGNDKPFIGALITLDADMLPGWLANKGLEPMSVADAAQDEQVLAALDRAVERANRAVSRAESIRRFEVLDTDFTEENGYLTPSLKVKRARVVADHAETIERIYGG